MIGRRWALPWVAAVWSMVAGLASAATLQISPVSIELGPDERGAAVTLRNPGSTPMFGQLRVYAWDQQDGQDVLAPTQSLAASPPLLQVPPGSEQLVRIVRTGTAEAGKESAFRILIDEIRDEQATPRNGVQILMRYSVPVFVNNGRGAAGVPPLFWSVAQQDGQWRLTVQNRGDKRARISQISVRDAQGRRHRVADGLLGYALAGRHHTWVLDIPAGVKLDERAAIDAFVNAHHVVAPVGLGAPTDRTNTRQER